MLKEEKKQEIMYLGFFSFLCVQIKLNQLQGNSPLAGHIYVYIYIYIDHVEIRDLPMERSPRTSELTCLFGFTCFSSFL